MTRAGTKQQQYPFAVASVYCLAIMHCTINTRVVSLASSASTKLIIPQVYGIWGSMHVGIAGSPTQISL
jgi:hypothetical protein